MLCPLWVVSRRSKLYHPNGKLRDELLNGEIFYTLREAQVIIEHWRNHYNTRRPHSALGYRPPAPEVVLPKEITDELQSGRQAA